MASHDAYHQGRKARRKGKPVNDNPYNGEQLHEWKDGWQDQDKLIEQLSPVMDSKELERLG